LRFKKVFSKVDVAINYEYTSTPFAHDCSGNPAGSMPLFCGAAKPLKEALAKT
jgi:hypothetical protein